MSIYFTVSECVAQERIRLLRSLISECELHTEPCPLLDIQLNKMSVFVTELDSAVRKMQAALAKRKA